MSRTKVSRVSIRLLFSACVYLQFVCLFPRLCLPFLHPLPMHLSLLVTKIDCDEDVNSSLAEVAKDRPAELLLATEPDFPCSETFPRVSDSCLCKLRGSSSQVRALLAGSLLPGRLNRRTEAEIQTADVTCPDGGNPFLAQQKGIDANPSLLCDPLPPHPHLSEPRKVFS